MLMHFITGNNTCNLIQIKMDVQSLIKKNCSLALTKMPDNGHLVHVNIRLRVVGIPNK